MSDEKNREEKNEEKPLEDLGVSGLSRKPRKWQTCTPSSLPEVIIKRAYEVGVVSEDSRAATYFQIDHSVLSRAVQKAFQGQLEVMSTKEAMKKYDWSKKYWWNLINKDMDQFTRLAYTKWDHGYFIRILEDQKVTLPLQSCFFVFTDYLNQNVHNVIIAEPGSEAQIITGCTVHPNIRGGLHVGVSEFYIKEGAKLTFTMIHAWNRNFNSHPRSAALIEDDAVFVSNYLLFQPVRNLQTYPTAYCKGANSRVEFNNIIYGSGDSHIDVGSKVILQNSGARGEIITRALATDNAKIYARGLLQGEHEESKAHLECRGLLLSDNAMIYTVPELLAKAQGADLSHEAAVGKIAEEEICYLMSRGFSEKEATSLIVRGFMDVSIFGLPRNLEENIKRIISITAERAL